MGDGGSEGFARATEPIPFRFPEDHGPHPAFQTEWWYLTGNLESESGRRFGFQFTIFRSALAPREARGLGASASGTGSEWSTDQVFMGHFALTDEAGGTFHHFERFSRGSLGLAGARTEPFRVWLEDWSLRGPVVADSIPPRLQASSPFSRGSLFPLQLDASDEGAGISLTLTDRKPKVLQGDRGLSQKGPEAGNASYYYSFTRLGVAGDVVLDGVRIPVDGEAWFDREWSTSALSAGQVGWDWFALQLDDGRDLMYYQLRLEDGSPDPLSKGILVGEDGASTLLTSSDVDLSVLESWESPLDGTRYPSAWALRVPGEGVDLSVRPILRDQELNLTFRYWEGAVDVTGEGPDGPVAGRGYVELTGYADRASRGGEPAGR
jgi:predicted secreted hydrolase